MPKSLLSKLDLAKIRLRERVEENPARLYFFLKLKIFACEFFLSFSPLKDTFKNAFGAFLKFLTEFKEISRKFLILIFSDPSKSFSALVAESESGNCPYSYSEYKNYQKRTRIFSAIGTGMAAFIIALIISSSFFSSSIRAATYTFTQTNWAGGATANNATHTSNQTGWTEYSAKDTNLTAVNSGADLQLVFVPTVNEYTIGALANINVDATVVTDNANGTWTITLGAADLSRIFKNDKFKDEANPQKSWKILSSFDSANKIIVIDSEGNGGSPSAAGATQATVGRWYASISLWETGREGNLVTRSAIERGLPYYDGNADTTAVTIDGWTTDATHYIEIYVPLSERHRGVWDNNKYRLVVYSQYSPIFIIQEEYTRVEGLQIENTSNKGPGTTPGGIQLNVTAISSDIRISSNIMRNTGSGTGGSGYGIHADAVVNFYVWNNIIYGFDTGMRIVHYSNLSTNHIIYNNTLTNNTTMGIIADINPNPVLRLYNNIANGNTTDYSISAGDIDASGNNISEDTTSPDAAYRSKAVTFVDETNRDLHLQFNDNTAKDAGADLSADANLAFTTDIDNDTRSGTWDIGADDVGATLVKVHSIGTVARNFATLQGWENARDGVLTTRQVFKTTGQLGGAFAAGQIIKGCTSAATGTYIPERDTPSATETYMTLDSVTGIFQANETVMVSTDSCATPTGPRTTLSTILTTAGTIERGEAYKDSTFTAGVTIDDSTTNATHYMWLTAAPSSRHTGVAGDGVKINAPVSGGGYGTIRVVDTNTLVEWLDITSTDGTAISGGSSYSSSSTYRNLILHDNVGDGINVESNVSVSWVYNVIIYNSANGIYSGGNVFGGLNIYNSVIYNNTSNGVLRSGPSDIRNVIAVNNGIDFNVNGGAWNAASSNNISSDATAPGANSFTNQTLSQVAFVSTTAGIEDLHLLPASVAKDAGASLSSTFTTDIDDGQTRPVGSAWDIGADEHYPVYQYPASQTLTSSAYDSSSAANLVAKITWTGATPAGTEIKLQMRSATTSTDLSWHNWCGYEDTTANCNGGYYFTSTSTNTNLPSAHTLKSAGTNPAVQDDRWLQYKVILTSTGTNTPTLSDITITYVVNSPPEFDATYGTRGITVNSQASDGTITFLYKIRDPDTTSSTNQDPGAGFVSPSFEYSTNGGGSWTTITGGFSTGATTSKAVTEAGWNTYTVVWTPTSTPLLSGTYTTQGQIRISLNDGEAANNTVSTTSALFTLDAKNPTVSVNPRITATSTTPTLYFSTTDDSSLQMRIGLNSDLSDNLNWVSYGNSTTTTLVTDPDTAYIQFRDVYDNRTSIYSVATPETPANFVVQDTSNIQTSEYRLFLAWQVYANSGNFASYRIYRSTDNGSTYSLLTTITDRTVNYYLDQSLTASSTYYYKVASMDTSGNGSFFSSPKQAVPNGAQDAGEGGGGNPADPPTISSVSSGTTTTQSTTITWQTKDVNNNAKLANSTVGYCSPAPCSSGYTTQGVASFVSSHSVVLRGLSPNTSYSYYAQSTDPYNNTASSTGYTFTTNSGPSISGVAVTDITDVSAQITWNTNIAASGYVVYASSSPPSGYESGWGTRDTTRTVSLTGLQRGVKYWFYVKSQDIDSNWAYDYNVVNGETKYFDFTTSQDSTAPTISNVIATSTTDTVSIIYWATNEEATSQIEYGVATGNYTNISPLNTGLNIAHYQKIDNLNQNTTYYYRVASVDGSGNTASSTEKTFLTLDAQIARSRAGEFSGGGGVPQIIYLTEVEQREKLEKQLAELEKRPEISKEDLAILKKELEDLRLKTVSKDLYDKLNAEYEKLKAGALQKAGSEEGKREGETQSPEEIIKALAIKFKEAILSFSGSLTVSETEELLNNTTESLEELSKIVPPPVMSAEPQIEIGSNYAVVQWKTNKEANSIVAYAADSAYSPTQSEPYTTQIGNSDELVKEHIVKLENLSPSTVYHYQMKSKAKLGDYGISKDFSFITKAEAPRISDASIQRLGLTDAKVNWRTLTLADSLLKYTPVRNGIKLEKESKTEGDPNFVLVHELNIKNLEPDTGYFVEIFSKDSFGNIESKPLGSFFTSKDTSAPFISQVKIENSILPGQEGRVQTIIAWKTDEPSTSQIAYEQGANFKEMPQNLTPIDRNLTTSHTVVLTNFRAGILYRFRVISKDTDGNEAQTKDYTVFTPQSAKGILEIILENFESTFGWTKKLGF